jgi:hypothetical protein
MELKKAVDKDKVIASQLRLMRKIHRLALDRYYAMPSSLANEFIRLSGDGIDKGEKK